MQPVPILLGKNRRNIDATFHYVPILSTLEAMLENVNNFAEPEAQPPNTGVLKDFTDGKVFRSITLFHEHPEAQKLILFEDAFEVVNPLGSAKKKHKVLDVYLMLGNVSA